MIKNIALHLLTNKSKMTSKNDIKQSFFIIEIVTIKEKKKMLHSELKYIYEITLNDSMKKLVTFLFEINENTKIN